MAEIDVTTWSASWGGLTGEARFGAGEHLRFDLPVGFGNNVDLGFGHARQIGTAGASHNGNFALGQFRAEALGNRAEINLLKSIFVQIADVARPIIVLAGAGDGEIAVDGEIVIGLAGEGLAIETLAFEASRPFHRGLEALAKVIADDPVESAAF